MMGKDYKVYYIFYPHPGCILVYIEVLNVKVGVSVLLVFASILACSQNQTAVSDTLHLLSDF
jgi:hypothetical protein